MDEAYVEEQNKIASSGAWIWLLEIRTSPNTQYRFANNNVEIDWDSGTYLPISFTMSDIIESTSGKFPEYQLRIGHVAIGSGLHQSISTSGGLVGQTVRLMVVHSAHLDLTTPAVDELAEILNCEVTAEAITFTIGTPSLLSRRFPRDRYVPGFCRHRFKGALCQYEQPASNTLTSNNISFILGGGGVPGTRFNTVQVASGGLITDVFANSGELNANGDFALFKDTGFTVSGSVSNDGVFLANNHHHVEQTRVRVFVEADKARPFVTEAAGNLITIQLGYDTCDKTLSACALRDNTQHYGGSPGIVGGMYG